MYFSEHAEISLRTSPACRTDVIISITENRNAVEVIFHERRNRNVNLVMTHGLSKYSSCSVVYIYIYPLRMAKKSQ